MYRYKGVNLLSTLLLSKFSTGCRAVLGFCQEPKTCIDCGNQRSAGPFLVTHPTKRLSSASARYQQDSHLTSSLEILRTSI